MKDSVTYQAIVEEGMVKARQEDILRFGTKFLGVPDEATEKRLRAAVDLDHLSVLYDRALQARSWEEVFSPEADS